MRPHQQWTERRPDLHLGTAAANNNATDHHHNHSHNRQQQQQQRRREQGRARTSSSRRWFSLPVLGFFRDVFENHEQETAALLLNQAEQGQLLGYSSTATTTTDEEGQQQQQQPPQSTPDFIYTTNAAEQSSSGASACRSSSSGTISPRPEPEEEEGGRGGLGGEEGEEESQSRARQLWKILEEHIRDETFQIQNLDFRNENDAADDDGDGQQEQHNMRGRISRRNSSHRTAYSSSNRRRIDQLDLPYDFSVSGVTVAFLVYLAIAILAFSYIFEDFTLIDSMYFAVVTFTTIGYGDKVPKTMGGKLFTAFFAMVGIAILGIGLGVVGSKLVETQLDAINRARQEVRREWLWLLQTGVGKGRRQQRFATAAAAGLNLENTTDESDDSGGGDGSNSLHPSMASSRSSSFAPSYGIGMMDDSDEVNVRQEVKKCCSNFSQLLLRYCPALLPLFFGSIWIGKKEGWTWYDAVYYCVVTTTTVGYGDLTPELQYMKLFAVLFIPLAVGAMGHCLGTVANFVVESRRMLYHKKLWLHELSLDDLDVMDIDRDGAVSELDYIIFMLQAMQKVDKELIDALRTRFQQLDLTESGTLVREDLELMARRRLRRTRRKLELSSYKYRLTHAH